MINHARTLLLNLGGPAEDDKVFIAPLFSPLVIPKNLFPFSQVIIPFSASVAAQNFAADVWMTLLQSPDTEKYALALDPRLTYRAAVRKRVDASGSFNVANAMRRVVEIGFRQSGTGRNGLFRPVPGLEEELLELKALWDGKVRNEDKAVAAVYGYIYQLERVRRNV